MPSISVIIIARNEKNNIEDCVRSAQLVADEVVVFDGDSTDNTATLAQALGAKAFSVPATQWQGYGEQRRRAQSKATGDWCFWLDADERITPELAAEIKDFVVKKPRNAIMAVPRLNHAFGACIRHCGYYPDRVLRLHHRDYTRYNDSLVHEKLELPSDAQIINAKADLVHYTYVSMEQLLRKQVSYGLQWADNRYRKTQKGCFWFTPFMKGAFMFLRKYFILGGFLDGKAGFVISATSVTYTFSKYMALYVLAFKARQEKK